jgi:hypothetical protein
LTGCHRISTTRALKTDKAPDLRGDLNYGHWITFAFGAELFAGVINCGLNGALGFGLGFVAVSTRTGGSDFSDGAATG